MEQLEEALRNALDDGDLAEAERLQNEISNLEVRGEQWTI